MKSVSLVLLSALLVGHTLGYYLPSEYGSPCGCGGTPIELPSDDTNYKFDFAIEEPKVSDSERDLKSYNYQVQMPPSESMPDETKYKFDYSLQAPVEEKPVETQPRTMYTKVDRVTEDKTECSCKHGSPCTCGYSPEQCATQCQSAHNHAYVLPVRYDNGGDYVVYELPQDNSAKHMHRTVRQVDPMMPITPAMPFAPAAPAAPAAPMSPLAPLANLVNLNPLATLAPLLNGGDGQSGPFAQGGAAGQFAERFRSATSAIRERIGRLSSGSAGAEPSVGSTLNVSALKEKFTSIADPLMSHATKMIDTFRDMASNIRSKRDVNEMRMPMLRVKEFDASRDGDRFSKYLTKRVELKTPEKQDVQLKEMEKATHCHSCGSQLTESTCKRCGAYQPQYVEFVEGKPVSYYPGAVQEMKNEDKKAVETASPRYIYDRYGHRYLENNGNLRLIAPQYQEAVVGDQPNFAGLANILSENREIMQQLNQNGERMIPQPVDAVAGLTKLIRDMARARNADGDRENRNEKRSTHAVENKHPIERKDEKMPPRSMYQVVPMQYDGQDGKLVVRVYAAKDEEAKKYAERSEQKAQENGEVDMIEASQPTVRKYSKNDKEFEILTFDDYKSSSDEDIRRVIEHLHGKQQ